ncbi:MAG: MBL fold metallo-hydrolase [Candidatus Helarchaeota archaeon]
MDSEDRFKEIKRREKFYTIDNDVFMIFQDKTSMNFNSCNTYLIQDGKEIILIDPGVSRRNFTKVLNILHRDLTDIKHIILTHAHSDHYVLIKYLQKKCTPEIYIHQADRQFLEDTNKYINFLFDLKFFKTRPRFTALSQILNFLTLTEQSNLDLADLNLNPAIKSIFDTWNIYSITPDHEYSDKESLPGGLKVLHLPGHSPGHCGLLFQDHSLIFCADIDFNKRGPNVSGTYANIKAYKESLVKLIHIVQQKNIKTLFPGHWNPVFSKLKSKIEAFYQEFEIKEQIILNILNNKKQMTIDEISSITFKAFANDFKDLLNETTQDSLLVAEASNLLTDRNYLKELIRLKKVKKIIVENQVIDKFQKFLFE